ncbi:adenylyl-sulfate kinase [Arthrobacter sp. H14]|uniref:adenylyl-sulfate kinase n=1 Tax=Arthrobacter sp. H14 TaxID=1312959 RepID=UPI0004B18F2C|nr:adenylyl-sulfate kinase [Arthrobacter sp. H14]
MTPWQEVLHEPSHSLDYSILDTLELLMGGLLGTTSYMLPGQVPSNLPVEPLLTVPRGVAEKATEYGALLLADPDGTPLARLEVTSTEAAPPDAVYLAGPLTPLQKPEHSAARDLRITAPFNASGTVQIVAAFDCAPTAEQLALAVATAQKSDAQLHLIALSGAGDATDNQLAKLLAAVRACAGPLEKAEANLLVVPDYAATTHEGEGSIGDFVLRRLGAREVLNFSSLHEPARSDTASPRPGGMVVLFTGLSGSGKSTVARAVLEQIQTIDDRQAILLDGDDVRRFLTAGLGFTREDRNTNVERIGWVASLISSAGGIAVCAPIAPFDESRKRVREFAERAGQYILVHVSTPLEVCERRDRKGLYAKARAGLIPDFTGIDSPYDEPADADYVVDTSVTSVKEATDAVLRLIAQHSAIPGA